MDQATLGLILYALGLANLAAIYAVMALGLNLNWGVTGLFNAGVAGFFAVGAYTSVILTAPESPHFLGGFQLPLPVGMVAAMLVSGVIAFGIGATTIRLRSDYLAIGTIGIAEIILNLERPESLHRCSRHQRSGRVRSGQRVAASASNSARCSA